MINHYLMFNRNCEEALKVYEQALCAQIIEMQKYGGMPSNPAFPVPEADKNLVLHAKVIIDGAEIMCADSSRQNVSGNNMYISITTPDAAFVQEAWRLLKEGADIYMEPAATFFAEIHASLKDRFGVNWMFTVPK